MMARTIEKTVKSCCGVFLGLCMATAATVKANTISYTLDNVLLVDGQAITGKFD